MSEAGSHPLNPTEIARQVSETLHQFVADSTQHPTQQKKCNECPIRFSLSSSLSTLNPARTRDFPALVSSSLELNVGSDDDKLQRIGHSLSPGKVALAFVVLRLRNVDNKLMKRIGHSVERWTHDDREVIIRFLSRSNWRKPPHRDNFANRFSPRFTSRGGWVL